MSREVHVRFCEQRRGKFPPLTLLVMGFERQDDARRVLAVLPKRFEKYGLTIHPEKTRRVSFYPPQRQGGERSSFDFVGFTHYWDLTKGWEWFNRKILPRYPLPPARVVHSVYA